MTAAPPNTAGAERYVIDASAMFEYLLRTPTGLLVARLTAGAWLIAPEMLDAEILSVLRKETLGRRIDEAAALAALAELVALPVERVSHQTLVQTAWRYYHNISAYDALYVAAAEVYSATVITCDGRLARTPASARRAPVHNIGIG